MTTKHYFFERIFQKSDERKFLYKDFDFNSLSPPEKHFLKKLTFFSKYKSTFRPWLTSSDKTSTLDKKAYIDYYRGHLEYEEYIKFERAIDSQRDLLLNVLYSNIFLNSAILLGLIATRPANSPLAKSMIKSIFLTSVLSYGYILSNRRLNYNPVISDIYLSLSTRLNKNPGLRSKDTSNLTMGAYFVDDGVLEED